MERGSILKAILSIAQATIPTSEAWRISSEEIINAVKEVLCQQISLSEADLVRETAKKFGYTRAVGTTESVISYTLKKLSPQVLSKNQKAETSPQNNAQTNQNHRRELFSPRWFLFISVFPFLRAKS